MGCVPLAGGTARRLMLAGAMTATVLVAVPAAALGHIERTAYWPDPAPDTSVTPAAGGDVPAERSLASAVQSGGTGQTRVVCQRNSMRLLAAAIDRARQKGVTLRPSQKPEPCSSTGGAGGTLTCERFRARV